MAWDEIDVNKKLKQKSRQLRLIRVSSAVAAAVAIVVLGVYFFNAPSHPEGGEATRDLLVNDIAPGGNKATIKIGDGEAITLSDKQTGVVVGDDLRYSDNSVVISKEERDLLNSINKRSLPYGRDDSKSRMLTVSTPRGGTYQVTLPDGTKVWLNAASVLTYTMPLKERGGIRKVELSGEAYFEVFRNKNQPFIVTAKNLTTTVLGTHFNISAYDDEGSAKTTLLEGSVKVNHLSSRADAKDLDPSKVGMTKEARDDVILKPSQQASVTGSSGISIKQVDPENIIDWKNNDFVFNGTDFKTAMRKIARWYNVEIIYDDDLPESLEPGGWISRKNNISVVLKRIEASGQVHFKIEGRRIRVTR
ncbi:FecR family protein [Pedobacter heparinus]|uniref:FecR family protein n=1 Tax=Pedobacter heparinus TaxID=984 RepID=UPI00292D3EE0|nr:FecR domain-containing protein [Pedobacter heparinus]